MTTLRARIFKLRLSLLWIRHSWRFRWAHKPLCSRFEHDVLRVRGLRICRSCICAYAGIAVAAMTCLLVSRVREASMVLLAGFVAPTLALSVPWLYKRLPRFMRDILRFSMGCCVVLSVCAALTGHALIGLGCGALLFIFWKIYFAMRAKRKAEACNGCPELGQGRICSGFQLQAGAVRAYETEATRLLIASGGGPCIIQTRQKM